MKRYPVTSFNIHSRSVGSVSLSEQPDRPGFRANFSHWGPGGLDLKPHPIRAVLKLPKTHPIRVSSGFDYLRTDQMFGPMPLLLVPDIKIPRPAYMPTPPVPRGDTTSSRRPEPHWPVPPPPHPSADLLRS